MLELGKNILRLVILKYLSEVDAIKCIKLCKQLYNLFTDHEKWCMRMKCSRFNRIHKERQSQISYIQSVIDKEVDKEVGKEIDKKVLRKSISFCNGCAFIIRNEIHNCRKDFRECPYCKMPVSWYGAPYGFNNEGTSLYGTLMAHNIIKCCMNTLHQYNIDV